LERYVAEILAVERNDRCGLAVCGRLEHHLVGGIAQLRTPQKMCLYGFSHGNHRIHENTHLRRAEPGGDTMFGPTASGFIFKRQRDVGQYCDFVSSCFHQQCSGCALWATHGGDDDISVENHSHITSNIISLAMFPAYIGDVGEPLTKLRSYGDWRGMNAAFRAG